MQFPRVIALRAASVALGAALFVGAVSSSVSAQPQKISTDKPLEGQALIRWHSAAMSQGALAPSGAKESKNVRDWIRQLILARLHRAVDDAQIERIYPNVGWALVKYSPQTKTETALKRLSAEFGSGNASANALVKSSATPNDSQYSRQWWAPKVGAPFAWDASTGNSNIVVAVLDSGAQLSHADLNPNLWRNSGEIPGDRIDNDGNGYVDDVYGINTVDLWETGEYERGKAPEDNNGHGTHVAGILGARGNNGSGVAGVNWNVSVMPLRFLGQSGYGSLDGAIEAIDYILMMKKRGVNIRVSNHSWGTDFKSSALEDAFKKLTSAGILSVCAAGNGTTYYNGSDNDSRPNYPSSFNNSGIVAVAATTANDSRASFSNYGRKSVDLAAPGADIYSLGLSQNGETMDGTSQATPIVAGGAALLLAAQPSLKTTQLRSKILASVDKIPALKNVVATGGRFNLARLLGQTRVTVSGDAYTKIGRTKTPLAGVQIRIENTDLVTYSDRNGQWSFADLPIRRYKFLAALAGYSFSSKTVSLSEKSAPKPVSFEGKTKSTLYTISGYARSTGGSGVQGVEIFLNGTDVPAALTDWNGFYSIAARTAGSYSLSAQSPQTQWTTNTPNVALPTFGSSGSPNAMVNFSMASSDTSAPSISISAPQNGDIFSQSAPAATGTASDESGVQTLFFSLERNLGGTVNFYDWNAQNWVANFGNNTVTQTNYTGQNVNWSRDLPTQTLGEYRLMVWSLDVHGNETPIGAETLATWTVASGSGSSAAASAKTFGPSNPSVRKF